MHIEETILRYLMQIVRETRNIVGIGHGVSVRGGLQFLQATRALAFVRGHVPYLEVGDHVTDVATLADAVRSGAFVREMSGETVGGDGT